MPKQITDSQVLLFYFIIIIFFFYKQGCLDLFKYVTILLGVCSFFSIPYAPSYYWEES